MPKWSVFSWIADAKAGREGKGPRNEGVKRSGRDGRDPPFHIDMENAACALGDLQGTKPTLFLPVFLLSGPEAQREQQVRGCMTEWQTRVGSPQVQLNVEMKGLGEGILKIRSINTRTSTREQET